MTALYKIILACHNSIRDVDKPTITHIQVDILYYITICFIILFA